MRPLLALSTLCLAALPLTAHADSASRKARQFRPPLQSYPQSLKVELSGTILTPDGAPAAHASVALGWMNGQQAQFQRVQADANGAFHISGAISRQSGNIYSIAAYLPQQGFAWKQAVTQTNTNAKLTLKMEPTVRLSGQLLTTQGRPATNTTVSVNQMLRQGNHPGEVMVSDSTVFHGNLPPLPTAALKSFFSAKTDAEGNFTLTGLPQRVQLALTLQKGLMLAPGSMTPISVDTKPQQNTGTLIVTPSPRLVVRFKDRMTGKPLPHIRYSLSSTERLSLLSSQFQFQSMNGNSSPLFRNAVSGETGEERIEGLFPGDYNLFVNNCFRRITLEAGKETTIDLPLRRGQVKGRLLDAAGKPVANTQIFMNAGISGDDAVLQGNNFGTFGWEKAPRAQTDSKGNFTIGNFPWESAWVTIRANRGNDRAEYHGSPDKFGSQLMLKLKKNVLTTVTGRLIDPKRKPISQSDFLSVHWTNAPRSFWVANAQNFRCDKDGRFKVTGLERNASFSLITGTRFAMGGMGGGRMASAKQPFESPRFSTPPGGLELDLGDVMVHPSDEPEEIEQVYGFSNSFSDSPGFIPEPTQTTVNAAKQAWKEYKNRLIQRDLDGLQNLTARVSAGWSADRRNFLMYSSLRPTNEAADTDKLVAMRFMPRRAALSLLRFDGIATVFGRLDTSGLNRELDARPNWVFLAEKKEKELVPVAALCEEEGAWRVVGAPEALLAQAFAGNSMFFGGFNGVVQTTTPEVATIDKAAIIPATEQMETATEVGKQFLRHWSQDHLSSLHMLTAPQASFYNEKPEAYAKLFQRRIDKGRCPIDPEQEVTLTPMTDLSQWELEWLTAFSRSSISNRGFQFGQMEGNGLIAQNTAGVEANRAFPTDYANKGALALLRYTAEGHKLAMVLIRTQNNWKVLEPAFLLGNVSERTLAMR